MPVAQAVIGAPLTLRVASDKAGCDLAHRAARGDRRAFSALMTAHKDELYRFVRRRAHDPEDAYDIVQEAFIAAWAAMGRYDPERPFDAWLKSIALNKCRDHARRRNVRHAIMGACDELAGERIRADGPTPEEDLIARDELAVLARAVAALPTHLRDALMLTAVDGLSQAAAGAVLGCSVKAVEYRVHRAREAVTRAID